MKHFELLFYFGRKSGERKCFDNSSDVARIYQLEVKLPADLSGTHEKRGILLHTKMDKGASQLIVLSDKVCSVKGFNLQMNSSLSSPSLSPSITVIVQ